MASSGRLNDVLIATRGQGETIMPALGVADVSAAMAGSHWHLPGCPKAKARLSDREKGTGGCDCGCGRTWGDWIGLAKTIKGFATMGEAAEWTAEVIGHQIPERKGTGRPPGAKDDPARSLRPLPKDGTFPPAEELVRQWCEFKRGPSVEACQAIGCAVALHRCKTESKEYHGRNKWEWLPVLAIPVFDHRGPDARRVNYRLIRLDGKPFPAFKGNGQPDAPMKIKTPGGNKAKGLSGPVDLLQKLCDGTLPPEVIILWEEGETDMLTMLAADVPENVLPITHNTGAHDHKLTPELVNLFRGRTVWTIWDADRPGQDGAKRLCKRLAPVAAEVRNVTLPHTEEREDGVDVRDYLNGGGTIAALIERAEEMEPLAAGEDAAVDERPEDPHRLARLNLAAYKTDHGGRLLYWRDGWWKWKTGRYRRLTDSELKRKVCARIEQIFQSDWRGRQGTKDAEKPKSLVTTTLVRNVVAAMEALVGIPDSLEQGTWLVDRSRPQYVSLQNGILDMGAVFSNKPAEECLLPHSPQWFSPTQLGYQFDPGANCHRWLQYLDECMESDQERIALLQEWAGYLLTVGNPEQKFLALEGEGGNGKTVFLAAMTAMIGEENISSVPLAQFGDRFALAGTLGKAANIDADVDRIDSVAEGVLKAYTGGDRLTFDRKNREPITAIPSAKLMFSWNTRPRLRDRSHGLWRRMLLVPFNKKPAAKNRDLVSPQWWIDQGEAPGILLWAIAGLHRLQRQGDFTEAQESKEAVENYRGESNPALMFFAEGLERVDGNTEPDSGIVSDDIYSAYEAWCKRGGYRPLNNIHLGRELNKFFGNPERKKLNAGGKYKWGYLGIKFSAEQISRNQESNGLF